MTDCLNRKFKNRMYFNCFVTILHIYHVNIMLHIRQWQSWPNRSSVRLVTQGSGFESRVWQELSVGGRWITVVLSTFNTTTEVRPLSKAPNPHLLPGCCSIGCPLLQVCVCSRCVCVCALGWVKCREQILSMGHHTWPHVNFSFFFFSFFTVTFELMHSI